MLQANNLSKKFGDKEAVNIPNLHIGKGEAVGLVGNNGAGKTTFFRLALDLYQATTGEVHNHGINVAKSEDWKSMTAAYVDNGFLIEFLTPEEYFYFHGEVRGLDRSEVDRRLVRFEKFMNGEILGQKKYIRNFSSGNKQKIGIIAAFIAEPDIIILDEPFNFLDSSSQIEIKRILMEFNREKGTTTLISSHNLDHIVDVSSRILLMENGKIINDIDNRNGEAVNILNDYFETK
jgi:ABC-2 type transport system ATP-binding protein